MQVAITRPEICPCCRLYNLVGVRLRVCCRFWYQSNLGCTHGILTFRMDSLSHSLSHSLSLSLVGLLYVFGSFLLTASQNLGQTVPHAAHKQHAEHVLERHERIVNAEQNR